MWNDIIVAGIGVIGVGGLGTAIVALVKDRRKDDATADLTSVEALQNQVIALKSVSEFWQSEYAKLRAEYDISEEKNRRLRTQVSVLEEKLDQVERNALRTQKECEELRSQIREIKESPE